MLLSCNGAKLSDDKKQDRHKGGLAVIILLLVNGIIEQGRDPRDLADQGQFCSLAGSRVDDTDDRQNEEEDAAQTQQNREDVVHIAVDIVTGHIIKVRIGIVTGEDRVDDRHQDAIGDTIS